MSIDWLLKIVSGKERGPLAAALRLGLWSLTPVYRLIIGYRNRKFDSGSALRRTVDAKVVSVGNLTTGGTGKTPLVIWICELLQKHQIPTGIVSRGYRAGNQSLNDEGLELAFRLPAVPHVQSPDRAAAARQCVAENGVRAIVLDDGFQHRRLARDLDIVLIDASNPFGFDYLLPRGTLREPVSSLKRADMVVITRCDRVKQADIDSIRLRIEAQTSAPIVLSRTRAVSLIRHTAAEVSLEHREAKKWFSFSAIGNPDAFEARLESLGFAVVGSERFRDHHRYSDKDLKRIASRAKQAGASHLICTHKDLVKIDREAIDSLPLLALKIDLDVFAGSEMLEAELLQLFALASPK